MDIRIIGPKPGDGATCESILRSLPQWFGIEEAIVDYGRSVASMPTFSAVVSGHVAGVLSLKEHFPESAEIHVMAVRPQAHRNGIGKMLLQAAEDWLKGRGVRILQVKTLGPSAASPEYAVTRAFYKKAGFIPVEEFPTLWSAANPCLMLVKPLASPA